MNDALYIAVDLGAGSGRVFLAGVPPSELRLEEVHRFQYPPSRRNGHLFWDAAYIFSEIKAGLREASGRAKQIGRPVHSIGVDSWGVDYGLVDSEGNLLGEPICYRDERTQGEMERVFERVSAEEIVARTGIQFLVFNTLFQLSAHRRAGIPKTAARLLLMPDLMHFFLTGTAATEYTNATTTQMVNARTETWDSEMLEWLGLPEHLLAEIVRAGTDLGPLKPALARELRLTDVRVVAPATHDTSSAVVGAPLEDGFAYVSSGTWSLVGVERNDVLINPEVARYNFSNEGGVFGTIRFLKNVMGLWILEQCRSEWQEQGIDVDYESLFGRLDLLDENTGLIFPDDPRFFNPPSMGKALSDHLQENGQPVPTDPLIWTKVILDSLAFRYASVLRTIESVTGQKINGVQIVGGGSRNDYLNQTTATVTGLPVLAGPAEATVTGNVLVQALAHGRFTSLADARRHVAENVQMGKFMPRPSTAWEETARRYAAIEERYVNNDPSVLVRHLSSRD